MKFKYFDICDVPYKRDDESGALSILRIAEDGSVYEDKPTPEERGRFARNWATSGVITEEIAYALAKNPNLSYSCDVDRGISEIG